MRLNGELFQETGYQEENAVKWQSVTTVSKNETIVRRMQFNVS